MFRFLAEGWRLAISEIMYGRIEYIINHYPMFFITATLFSLPAFMNVDQWESRILIRNGRMESSRCRHGLS